MTTREGAWLGAYCAVANTINGKVPDCLRFADACLKAFDERFPPRKICEAQFAGTPLSELTDEEQAEFRREAATAPYGVRRIEYERGFGPGDGDSHVKEPSV